MEVQVRGLTEDVDTEFLVLYLESKRHSGGGPVQSYTRDGSLALITFVNACDAENVLCKEEHNVNGVLIQVRRAPPWDPGKVAICCLHPETDDCLLELYVENVSRREEFTMVRSVDRRSALISFQDPLSDSEFAHMTQCVVARKLLQTALSLQRVRACTEVLVENVGDSISTELLEMYFESKRSGGGRVVSVTLLKHRSAAVVSFCDWEVVAQVLRRPHSLEKCQLAVSPYYPDLLGSPSLEDGRPPEEEKSEADLMENTEESSAQVPSDSASSSVEQVARKLEENMQIEAGQQQETQEEWNIPHVHDSVTQSESKVGPDHRGQPVSACGSYEEPATQNVGKLPMLNTELYAGTWSSLESPDQTKVEPPAISVQEVEVPMEASELRFIQEFCHDLLAGMDQVVIVPLDTESGFNVSGNAISCKTAVEILRHMASSLTSRTVTLEYPGLSLFLLEEDGQKALSDIEQRHQCIIDASELSWRGLDRKFVDPWSFLHDVPHTETLPAPITNTKAAPEPENTALPANMEGIKKIASLLRSVESDGDRHIDSSSEESQATTIEANIPPENIEEDIYTNGSSEEEDEDISEVQDEELEKICKLSRDEYRERELDEEAQLLLAIQMSMDTQETAMEEEDEELRRALELSLKEQVEEESEQSLQRALEMSFCDNGAYGHSRTFTGKDEAVHPTSCNEKEMDPDAVHIKVLAENETSLVVACAALRKAVTARLSTATVGGVRDLPHKTEILSALERKHRVKITVSEGQAHIQGFLRCPSQCRQELSEILSSVHEGATPQDELINLDVQQKVEMIQVPESSEEYTSVVQPFLSTLRRETSVTKVLQVQKVQNTLLYNQYQLKKKSMLVHDPKSPIEHILYHGTTESGAREICHQGFNRSFCGKNATLYGQGVYFAVDSSISAMDNYSPPSQEGKKFVLVARVLTGAFIVGKSDMRTPPIMTTSDEDVPRRYDSLVDNVREPSIFVIFNDTQAYPQYLLTCRTDSVPST